MKLPSFIQIAKSAISRVKASLAITVILLVIAALIWMWIWGPEWQFREEHPFKSLLSRILVTTLFVLLVVSWGSYKVVQRLRQLEKLQIKFKEIESDPIGNDVQFQADYLSLWKRQLQRRLGISSYLYQLPWYMVIGNRKSGKTALLQEGYKLTEIVNTAHELTTETSSTLHVKCLLGEDAVLIDPEGVLIEHPLYQDPAKPQLYSRLWEGLLSWLNSERSRQPLNGVILTVDLYQLITASKEQRENDIINIHQRLQDIRLSLHSELPLYIVLTKLDLLYGFAAMYQSLGRQQRDEILGVTFTLAPDNERQWHQELTHFWQQWMKQLNESVPEMMLNNVDANQRSQLFSFTRQVYGAYDYVVQLLEGILYHNSEHAKPILRGVYLASSQQRGAMDDLFTQSAAVQYRLGPQAFPTWPIGDTLSYFTRSLFPSVILAEPNLASENSIWRRQSNKNLLAFSCIGALVVGATWAGWQHYYRANYMAGEEVLAQTKSFLAIPPPKEKDLYGNLQLPILDPIREATLAHGNYHEKTSLLADMGLYQGNNIGPYVENTYLQLLLYRYLPALMNGLIERLNSAPAGSEEKLGILRIIRMLEDGSGRNKPLVEQYMSDRWSEVFHGQRPLQENLLTHLKYALEHTDWFGKRAAGDKNAIQSFAPYVQVIKEAQQELSKLSIYQRVYQNLYIKAQDVLPPSLNLRDHIGASFDQVFVANNERQLVVPQFLTMHGLRNYFVKQDESLVDLTVMDSWVLNLTQDIEYSEADTREIQRQISELYVGDYAATWRGAMSNLDIKEFDDIPQAVSAIEQVISGEQPLRRALQTLDDNTRLPPIADSVTEEVRKKMLNSMDYQLLTRIHREFSQATAVLVEHKEKGSVLQSVYQKLTELHRYLLAIQNSPIPGKAALKAVQLRLEQNSSDPIFEVQQMAKNLPEPLNRWVGELADESWRVVMLEAILFLEIEWNESVVKQYQTYLAGRYPFDPNAKEDVPLSEFERFFGPEGTLDAFYEHNLKPFIEYNLTRGSDGEQLIRPDVMQQIELAKKIRNVFFTPQHGLGVQYAIEVVKLSGNKRRSVLNLDGQLLDYSHGRSSIVHLVWPNSMRSGVESKLVLVPDGAGKSPRAIHFNGPWAQLRLINAGDLANIHNDKFDVRFKLDGGEVIYRIHVDESDNPFAGGLFSQFHLPDTLY